MTFQPTNFWSASDYEAVLDVMRTLRPSRVLEFGPGSSTLALVEGGALTIDSYEDDPEWAAVYRERLERRFPGCVRIHEYAYSDPLVIPSLYAEAYDLAFIDGPHAESKRVPVLAYALTRARAVLVAIDHCADLLAAVLALAGRYLVDIRETGPLAGAFALIQEIPCSR